MDRKTLKQHILQKQSYLCVGLDTDLDRIPPFLLNNEDPIFEFNKGIIDSTRDLCVAYKPNVAFYECYGEKGWKSLRKTIDYIGSDHFVIADAKRGDIGNTSKRYAKAFFEDLKADALTVAPYMGSDSVKPFLEYENHWVILLALTSNAGSKDFQFETDINDTTLYQKVLTVSKEWGSIDNMMYVIGATHPTHLSEIRQIIPDHFLLIPGVGAQGGDIQAISKNGLNDDVGLLINSSRSIIYASSKKDFADAARTRALALQGEMQSILGKHSY